MPVISEGNCVCCRCKGPPECSFRALRKGFKSRLCELKDRGGKDWKGIWTHLGDKFQIILVHGFATPLDH